MSHPPPGGMERSSEPGGRGVTGGAGPAPLVAQGGEGLGPEPLRGGAGGQEMSGAQRGSAVQPSSFPGGRKRPELGSDPREAEASPPVPGGKRCPSER